MPSVLGCSSKANVLPKLDWLQNKMDLNLGALRQRVVQFPAALAYSLDKRYCPRLKACCTAQVPVINVLNRIMMPDAEFYQSIGLDINAQYRS